MLCRTVRTYGVVVWIYHVDVIVTTVVYVVTIMLKRTGTTVSNVVVVVWIYYSKFFLGFIFLLRGGGVTGLLRNSLRITLYFLQNYDIL